jgi:hypothetical protein
MSGHGAASHSHDHAADLDGLRNLKTAGGPSEHIYTKIVDDHPSRAGRSDSGTRVQGKKD